MSTLQHISSAEEFKEVIMKDKAIIMIHKSECPFCEKAKPWMEEHACNNGECYIGEVNEKNIKPVLEVFKVKMYPTFVAFSKGTVVDTFYGDTKVEKVAEFVKRNVTTV